MPSQGFHSSVGRKCQKVKVEGDQTSPCLSNTPQYLNMSLLTTFSHCCGKSNLKNEGFTLACGLKGYGPNGREGTAPGISLL